MIGSEAFGPLAAELRRAEANGHDVDRLFPAAVTRHGLDDAEDIAAVLRYRLALATKTVGTIRGRRRSRLIAGLMPEAVGPMAPDMRTALDKRRDLIEQRARALAEDAIRGKAPWIRALGPRPIDRRDRESWARVAVTVAAYRDRHGVSSPRPLGGDASTDLQRLDRSPAPRPCPGRSRAPKPRDRCTRRQPAGHRGGEGRAWVLTRADWSVWGRRHPPPTANARGLTQSAGLHGRMAYVETFKRTPLQLFNLPQHFVIPLFQRPYVWKEDEQWEPLWKDIRRVAELRINEPHLNPQHFLGAVVLQAHDAGSNRITTWNAIDGQQRLTTLQLLMDATRPNGRCPAGAAR